MNKLRKKAGSLALLLLLVLQGANVGAAELDPKTLLATMSQTIGGLDRFVIRGDAYLDAGLGQGQIIEQASQITARIMRPNALHITNLDAEGSKELYFFDGTLTVSTQPRNFYAQTEIPKQIDAAVEFAVNELSIDAPLLDLLTKDPADTLTRDAESVVYLGPSLIGGALHHHIAIRGPEVDLQVWIAAEGPALPGKITMRSRWVAGNPRFVGFMSWDLDPKIRDGSLEFQPASGATRIDFIQNLEQGGSDE